MKWRDIGSASKVAGLANVDLWAGGYRHTGCFWNDFQDMWLRAESHDGELDPVFVQVVNPTHWMQIEPPREEATGVVLAFPRS